MNLVGSYKIVQQIMQGINNIKIRLESRKL
jgi:hypothetical protein